jgi:hypothetical protein
LLVKCDGLACSPCLRKTVGGLTTCRAGWS